jgi:Uma2 family endonuclease
MVSVAPIQPRMLEAKVVLRGISWQTFKALMNDLAEADYRISYDADALGVAVPLSGSTWNEAELAAMTTRVTLRGVRWQTYRALMVDVGDSRAWRVAYDQEMLEIRMPLINHEEPKGLIENFVGVMADELAVEIRQLGSLTLEREDLTRAVEPDSCFYIENEWRVRGLDALSFPKDPPSDLVVELDNTRSSINKFEIYAALGVPEIWRYRKQTLEVYQLQEDQYEQCDASLVFPFLPIAEVPVLIAQSREVGQRTIVRMFRQRVQALLQSD